MKRVGVVIGVFCLVLSFSINAHAWPWQKKEEPSTPAAKEEKAPKESNAQKAQPQPAAPTEPKIDKELEQKLKEKRAAVAKKMQLLNNTEWQIELTPISGKGKKETDVVTFKNNRYFLPITVSKGFPTTNITLTVQEDGRRYLETMTNHLKRTEFVSGGERWIRVWLPCVAS